MVFTVVDQALHVLLIRRGADPYAGRWALPGGFVHIDEDLDAAAERELVEETGVAGPVGQLAQLASYGAPGRDPRGRVVTVAYLALLPDPGSPTAGTDASAAQLRPVADVAGTDLAFDHDRILADGLERARSMLEHTPRATAFCPPEFTITELRAVYEAVWDTTLDPRDFYRAVTAVPDFLVATGRNAAGGTGRPVKLYRAGPARRLQPPIRRREPS